MERHAKRLVPSLFFAMLLLSLLVTGCSGVPFALVKDNYTVRPGTLAIVVGSNDEASNRIAELITQELKKSSAFRVMGQDEVASRVPKYPSTIIEDSGLALNEEETWLSRSSKNRVDAVHSKLKTDYIFVVWAADLQRSVTTVHNAYGGSSTQVTYHVNIEGRLLEYPKGKTVGYSAYRGRKGQSCCLLFRSEGKDIDIMLQDSAEEIVDKLVKITGTKKAGK